MRPSRKILRFLTVLSGGCGVSLLGLAFHLMLVTTFGTSIAALAALGGCIVLVSIVGFIGAGQDKSHVLVLFFYVNFLLVTVLFISCYAAFYIQEAITLWVKHHWTADVLKELRDTMCCVTYSDTVEYLQHRVMIVGIIGVTCILLLLVAMYYVVRIITVPIVMRSMLSVLNAILMLLSTGLFVIGLLLKVHIEITLEKTWTVVIFIVVGTLMLALSVLGIIGSKSKSRSLLLIYITGLGCCFIALMMCSVSAFSFSDNLPSTYDAYTSSTLACEIDPPGCSNCTDEVSEIAQCQGAILTDDNHWVSCNSTSLSRDSNCFNDMTVLNTEADQGYEPNDIAKCGKCPEWSASDVQTYIRNTLHLVGLFALVVCLFVTVGFTGALVLRRSLFGYQTDSI